MAVCHERFKRWVEKNKFKLTPASYDRRDGHGRVYALRITPRVVERQVLFVHGTGNDAVYPQVQIFQDLLRDKSEIFCFDVDGHGQQSTTTLDPSTVRTAVADAATQFFDNGIRKHIVGHSLGGALAIDAVASNAVEIDSLTVISTPLRLVPSFNKLFDEIVGIWRGDFFKRMTANLENYGPLGIFPAIGPFGRTNFPVRVPHSGIGGWGYINVVKTILQEVRIDHLAPQISCPTFLIYSGLDSVAPTGHGQRLQKLMPQAKLMSLRTETHFSTLFSRRTIRSLRLWLRDPVETKL